MRVPRHILHTVGPRYNDKYRTAAENALHSCYRNCLRILKEERLATIAFPCVYSPKKNYPREAAAHIAIRACGARLRIHGCARPPVTRTRRAAAGTVRRFLEAHYADVTRLVLVVDNEADAHIYERLLPLYCPRTPEEEQAARDLLPVDTGALVAGRFHGSLYRHVGCVGCVCYVCCGRCPLRTVAFLRKCDGCMPRHRISQRGAETSAPPPPYAGNEVGETVVEERVIKIVARPGAGESEHDEGEQGSAPLAGLRALTR